jgi:hypothetical protein
MGLQGFGEAVWHIVVDLDVLVAHVKYVLILNAPVI